MRRMGIHRSGARAVIAAGGLVLAILAGPAAGAATPPPFVNYQGVLRSSSNAPLSGAHDMVFRFYDAATGAGEILVDAHTAAGTNPVVVSNGMFSVQLGAGAVTDGIGPGVYLSLAEVFRDHAAAWLEIQVNGERLFPRVQIASAAFALNASHLEGKTASSFLDTSPSPQTKGGPLTASDTSATGIGVTGSGRGAGGYFFDAGNTGAAYLGYGDRGVHAYGDELGGWFSGGSIGVDATGSLAGRFRSTIAFGSADLGFGATGISASGGDAAGDFRETGPPFGTDPRGTALLGSDGFGVNATGEWPAPAGRFTSSSHSGVADLGFGDLGVLGRGSYAGGEFTEADTTAHAWLAHTSYGVKASGWVALWGEGEAWGVYALGTTRGGTLTNDNGSTAYLALDAIGLDAVGQSGGSFRNLSQDGQSYLAYNGRGIWGKGSFAGGTFSDMLPDFQNVSWADVATSTRKIVGTGSVSFVQNHPVEKDRSIVYAAPEGDEVAVYTRGTARLTGGQARVRLGETFQWVANPEVGLTAQVTPRDRAVPLAVTQLSTTEMAVTGPPGLAGEVVFDYVVWGLRIGFEETPVIHAKRREAFLPDPAAVAAEAGDPAAVTTSASRRFRQMEQAVGRAAPAGSESARALADAINEGRAPFLSRALQQAADEQDRLQTERGMRPPDPPGPSVEDAAAAAPPAPSLPVIPAGPIAGATRVVGTSHPILPVSERVTPGDVLAMDPDRPGDLRSAMTAADVTVAGCAVTPDDGLELPPDRSAVAVSGVVLCRADATYGPIRAGDTLTTSPTPAHAMRAVAGSTGAILGKAMEPLASGTGLIRVLIALR